MLKMTDISFSFEKKQIVDHLSLSLEKGEILAVMGPSGCGKTTLLGLIAGLLKPQAGTIECSFEKISYVFQEPRLFPWLTVQENLLAVTDSKAESSKQSVAECLAFVGLADCADKYPHELSGGMKIRVSLARALLYGGDLFLLDEPFAALDEELRKMLSQKLRSYLHSHKASAILVTHNAEDAAIIADRVLTLPY